MSRLCDQELAYLTGERRLGRIATLGANRTPHVVPVGWSYDAEHHAIDVGRTGHERRQPCPHS
jgi:pyridoxamine 5'-phosphate oxidase family protein